MRGDCLTCSRIEMCSETSIEKVLRSHTCPLFEPIPEPVYRARVALMEQYGDVAAVQAMLQRPQELEEGEE